MRPDPLPLETELSAKMYSLVALREKINDVYSAINGGRQFFNPTSLRMPRFVPVELGFIRTVSYLNVLYKEVGRTTVDIVKKHFPVFGLDLGEGIEQHPELVNALRTYLQHNLSPDETGDRKTKDLCEEWFARMCGTKIPDSETHWVECCRSLLNDANQFLENCLKCLRAVESDESCVNILTQWNITQDRTHQPHEFDDLISVVAEDMGQSMLDIVPFRKRYIHKWTQRLQTLKWGYEFSTEARRLVESALISEMENDLPLTGVDIMNNLEIPSGPEVGKLLIIARNLYKEEVCSKETLLQRLRDAIGSSDSTH